MTIMVNNTPVTFHEEFGLFVKHEEQCCPGGPNFSKMRGVLSHIAARPERVIACLDTSHSQGGWATARACKELGKRSIVFYPWTKAQEAFHHPIPPQQDAAVQLGAHLVRLQAGRSSVLYHQAKKQCECNSEPTYLMPNALKLPETVQETALEVSRTVLPNIATIIVSASSGTIAAGVLRGLIDRHWEGTLIVHMGYSRPFGAVRNYIVNMSLTSLAQGDVLHIVDEEYAYADAAKCDDPPWPCNPFYDKKAFKWWITKGRAIYETALLWNVG